MTGKEVPEAFWRFLREGCGLPAGVWHELPAAGLPPTARRLLDHPNDMTSTLSDFHGAVLRVEVLQQRQSEGLYLREVFLRTVATDAIVEYGVIAIALKQFVPDAQEAILAGEAPLGALLHRFQVPFVSAPLGFFALSGEALARTPLAAAGPATCHGRFNRLAKATGEPLAWIVEILPPG